MFKEGSLFNKISDRVNKMVKESFLPTKEKLGYESTVGVYGGKLKIKENGKMVYDNSGFVSKFDRFGDAALRTYDEHMVKDPIKLLKRHPRSFFYFLSPGSKRFRGNSEEISANAKRLGLADLYDLSPEGDGVEIKSPEVFTSGRALQDIYRADLIGSKDLEEIDRFSALSSAVEYINEVHEKCNSGVGELLPSDIIFRNKEAGEVKEPILNLPDTVWNPQKEISPKEQKATDMLDFMLSISLEELRRSNDWAQAQKALETIVSNYKDKEVISLTKSLVKRGRITFVGNKDLKNLSKISLKVTGLHNQARFGIKKGDIISQLKEMIIMTCENC